MTFSIRVLHVDDEPDFADLTATFLEREDDRITVQTANNAREALEYLRDTDVNVDCIVSDHDMPGQTGIEFLQTVRQDHTDLPFILYTGKGSEAVASDAVSAGVTDYLQKEGGTSQYTILANRIVNAVEQSQARRRVTETEQKLQQLAEKTDDILYMFNDDWSDLLFVNSAFEDIWGIPVAELEDDPRVFLDAIHPEDRGDVQQALEQVSNGQEVEIEYRVVPFDGDDLRWVRADSKPVFDSAGDVNRIVGFVRDITEQKAHERELREERTFIEQSLDALRDVFFVVSEDLEMRRWNDQIVDVTGYTDEQLAKMGPTDFVPDDQQDRIEAAVEEVLTTGTATVQAEVLTADGERIPYEFVVTRLVDPDGDVLGFAGVGRDITQQREREAELEQVRENYEELFNGMNDTAWAIDTNEEFLAVNDAAVETMGYSRDELLSMRPHDIDVGLEGGEITALIRDMPEDEIQVVETVHETKDGDQIPVDISSSLISYQGETAILSIARNISERKRRERQLEEFASVVSHDLRNPLNVAQGRLDLAQAECDSEHLEEIAHAHHRMDTLIEDLLTLAREGNEVSDRERVELAALVEECWDHVKTAGAVLQTEVDQVVQADRTRLQQLLENLLRNAVEHGGDDVTITVGSLQDGFYVEDDGSGIPLDRRERVFEAEYSTTEEGTGFGLRIVEQVAEAHSWQVRVTEGTGGGARFEITDIEPDG
ncbi:PAS domain S-box protein [Halobacterium hubeiense]|uniref:PAS domain-containing protein n=1 Tax=Halobacterium hubeiense TaxID=1407499 RepID=UPI003C77C46D